VADKKTPRVDLSKVTDWEDEAAPDLSGVDDWEDETQQALPDEPPAPSPAPARVQAQIEPPHESSPIRRLVMWANSLRPAVAGAMAYSTGGFPDELRGLLGARDDTLRAMAAGTGTPLPEFGDAYRARRDEYRDTDERMREEDPLAYHGTGFVAGALTPGPKMGGGLRGALKSGALMGGVSGLGNSSQDLTRPSVETVGGATGDVLANAALGTAATAAVYPWAQVVPTAAKDFAGYLSERYAPVRALKAAGAQKSDLKPLFKADPKKAYRLGRTLLDEGVIPAGANAEGVADRVEPALRSAGFDMGAALREADAAGAKFNLEDFLQTVERELIEPNSRSPGISNEINALKGKVAQFREMYPEGVTDFKTANKIKSDFAQGQVNWGNHWNNVGPTQFLEGLRKQFVGIFNDSIEGQIGTAAGPETQAAFEAAKARYGPLKWALDVSGRGRAGELGNEVLGLKDMQVAQTASQLKSAANADNPLGSGALGLAAAFASKLARERGASTMAAGADRLSRSAPLRSLASFSPSEAGTAGARAIQSVVKGPAAFGVADSALAAGDPDFMDERSDQFRAQRALADYLMRRGAGGTP
jgi:hypothetical protein